MKYLNNNNTFIYIAEYPANTFLQEYISNVLEDETSLPSQYFPRLNSQVHLKRLFLFYFEEVPVRLKVYWEPNGSSR